MTTYTDEQIAGAQDIKLIETGFSYWATTLNRVAARLALGRVKAQLAAERERADLLKLELDTAIASELEYRQKWLDEKDEVQNKTDLVRSMLIDAEAAEATLADARKESERLREVTITECEDAVTTPIARKPENHPTWEIYQALEALRHTATFSSPPSGQEANNVAQSLKP